VLLDRPFCLTTLLACNHEPGVTLRVIASNGWQTRTLEPVGSQLMRSCNWEGFRGRFGWSGLVTLGPGIGTGLRQEGRYSDGGSRLSCSRAARR